MTPEQAQALRKPFDDNQIGKLPKPYKKDSEKKNCAICGGYHGEGIHLDYVGHAATTDRLLQVDPLWNWEPLALTAEGLPKIDAAGGLWIKLTVCGVTRLGYGDAAMGHGVKEVIGDAIRNAAMRFGVALDLWSKEDLLPHDDSSENPKRKKRGNANPESAPRDAEDKPPSKEPGPQQPPPSKETIAALLAAIDKCTSLKDLNTLYFSTPEACQLRIKDAANLKRNELKEAGRT